MLIPKLQAEEMLTALQVAVFPSMNAGQRQHLIDELKAIVQGEKANHLYDARGYRIVYSLDEAIGHTTESNVQPLAGFFGWAE